MRTRNRIDLSDLDNLEKALDAQSSANEPSLGREWYWITCITPTGKGCLLGPYPDFETANRTGYEKLDVAFEVICLPTKDSAKANQMFRSKKLDGNTGIDQALSRNMHEKGLARQSKAGSREHDGMPG
jgi:hypothetical protein